MGATLDEICSAYSDYGIPISSEEQARIRFKKAKEDLLRATVAYADTPNTDTQATLTAAKKELSTASLFTHG